MEVLTAIPVIGGPLSIAVPFLLVLTIVVFVHEFGHYIVGRWCGIQAEVFSIGFGKALFGWTDRHGTRWQVAMLPLGGYVRFVGDMDPASAGRADDAQLSEHEQRVAFHHASLLRRVLTVSAGPVANFLLSVLLFAGIILHDGQISNEPVIAKITDLATNDLGFEVGDRVLSINGEPVSSFGEIIGKLLKTNGAAQQATVLRDGHEQQITVHFWNQPRILQLTPGMPAARAGLQVGDMFMSIDDIPVKTFQDMRVATASRTPGAEVTVKVMRGGKVLSFKLVPELVERAHPVTKEVVPVPTIGVSSGILAGIESPREAVPLWLAGRQGFLETWHIISGTMVYLYDMAFAGADTSQLGGPIRIAEISGDAAERGISSLATLIAILSASIGLINLFPIPILDGGHLMFYALEGLRGRPVSETWMQIGTRIGLALVLLLMVFATYNDLLRHF